MNLQILKPSVISRDVFATALHRHHLPLIFLFSSRPEQQISLAFNSGLLWELSTCVALDESYIPDDVIRLFLTDKFEEIKSTHRLRAYIPRQWPSIEILEELIERSSGQFIYASSHPLCLLYSTQTPGSIGRCSGHPISSETER